MFRSTVSFGVPDLAANSKNTVRETSGILMIHGITRANCLEFFDGREQRRDIAVAVQETIRKVLLVDGACVDEDVVVAEPV